MIIQLIFFFTHSHWKHTAVDFSIGIKHSSLHTIFLGENLQIYSASPVLIYQEHTHIFHIIKRVTGIFIILWNQTIYTTEEISSSELSLRNNLNWCKTTTEVVSQVIECSNNWDSLFFFRMLDLYVIVTVSKCKYLWLKQCKMRRNK